MLCVSGQNSGNLELKMKTFFLPLVALSNAWCKGDPGGWGGVVVAGV